VNFLGTYIVTYFTIRDNVTISYNFIKYVIGSSLSVGDRWTKQLPILGKIEYPIELLFYCCNRYKQYFVIALRAQLGERAWTRFELKPKDGIRLL